MVRVRSPRSPKAPGLVAQIGLPGGGEIDRELPIGFESFCISDEELQPLDRRGVGDYI
jgi:hypothetical protein